MKNILILIFTLCAVINVNAQKWKEGLKNIENPTFYDLQKTFNEYWEQQPEDQKWKKGSGYKQFKRFEWYWGPRVTKQGKLPADNLLFDEWKRHESTFEAARVAGVEANTWTSLGPSTIGSGNGGVGRINCIAFHPTDEDTFWIGAPAGGLWKTTDGGITWTTSYDDQPLLGVSDISIHPTDPSIMYIATGDGDGAYSLGTFGATSGGDTKSIGIMKSVDGGETWVPSYSVNVNSNLLIRRLFIDPDFPSWVYAASNAGILVSSDDGANWSNAQSGYFMDIERHPTDPNTMYASTFGGDAQIYVSTDGGINWNQTSNFTGIGRINIEVSAAAPDMVGLLCSDADDDGLFGLYSSDNKGQSWNQFFDGHISGNNLLGWEQDASDADGQGSYDLAFAIDPLDVNNMFVGGVVNWKTTDGGSNWDISNFWYDTGVNPEVHADKHFLVYHPLNSSVLYECNDGGVWKSVDSGVTWINLTDGLVIGQFYDIDCSQTDVDMIVGGFQDNGSKLRTSSGWAEASGGDGMGCQIDDQNGHVFTSYVQGVLYRDLWTNNWQVISDNIPGQPKGEWLTPFVLDPVDQSIIYAGYDEIYKSTDSGDSWTQVSNLNTGENLNYLTIAPDNANVLYAATMYYVLKSIDGGINWSDVTSTLPISSLNISRILAINNNNVIVTLSGYDAAEKVYLSTNGGGSWINITNSGLPNVPANCAVYDENTGELYIGTDLGVYFAASTNSPYLRYGDNMPNVVITDLDIMVSANKLRAASFGRGLWEVDLNTVSDTQAPQVSSLTPSNGDINIGINTSLSINFNESIQKGTGNIIIKKAADNTIVETIDVSTSSVAISSSTANITISVMQYETQYYVEVDATAFIDNGGNNYVGISDNSSWVFTTEVAPDTQSPLVVSLSPVNAEINVVNNTDLAITFDEEIIKGTGNITVKQLADQLAFETIDVESNNVTVSGSTSTITMSTDFNDETDYFVEIDAGAFLDLSDNAFAGISGSELWSFVTEIITGTKIDVLNEGMLLHYSKDKLTINFESKDQLIKEIRVFDVQGKEMVSKENERNNRQKFIVNEAFQKGVYIVIGVTDKHIYKEKFVVFE